MDLCAFFLLHMHKTLYLAWHMEVTNVSSTLKIHIGLLSGREGICLQGASWGRLALCHLKCCFGNPVASVMDVVGWWEALLGSGQWSSWHGRACLQALLSVF